VRLKSKKTTSNAERRMKNNEVKICQGKLGREKPKI